MTYSKYSNRAAGKRVGPTLSIRRIGVDEVINPERTHTSMRRLSCPLRRNCRHALDRFRIEDAVADDPERALVRLAARPAQREIGPELALRVGPVAVGTACGKQRRADRDGRGVVLEWVALFGACGERPSIC